MQKRQNNKPSQNYDNHFKNFVHKIKVESNTNSGDEYKEGEEYSDEMMLSEIDEILWDYENESNACTALPTDSSENHSTHSISFNENDMGNHIDEFDVFGQKIANVLRSLNEHKSTQLNLKCKIIRAIVLANQSMNELTSDS